MALLAPPDTPNQVPPIRDRIGDALTAHLAHLAHLAQTTDLNPSLAEHMRRQLTSLLHRHHQGVDVGAECAVLWVPRQYWDPQHARALRAEGLHGGWWADVPLTRPQTRRGKGLRPFPPGPSVDVGPL